MNSLEIATDATLPVSDITTNNVTSSKHGFAPKSPADATQFLNGAATPAYAVPPGLFYKWFATVEVTGSDASSLTLPGLNGDVDESYFLVVDLYPAADVSLPQLLPNGATSNLVGNGFYVIAGAPGNVGGTTRNTLYEMGDPDTSRSYVKISAKSGKRRWFEITSQAFQGGGNNRATAWYMTAMWDDTSTNLTSLVLSTNSAGNGVKVGSKIRAFKITV